jgi:GNAT superfamily N-acetyltransferase
MSACTVRRAVPADAPAYVALVRALADFEKLPAPDDAAAARLVADAFATPPRYELWVGELAGEVVAYAVTFPTYSTFRARPSLFLEDLFVHPRARRAGVATAILARLREEAVARGCGRFEWFVLDWNVDAQKLYAGIGAEEHAAWRLWRVDL